MQSFTPSEINAVSDALEVAEEVTANFYKFSGGQWKRFHYDIKTLLSLKGEEITNDAFALLNKGIRVIDEFESITKKRDFYYICLQDHQILKALNRDNYLGLFPLLVYILTHELVHVVRFCSYLQRFGLSSEEREKEERVVHATTFDILNGLPMNRLGYVLESYKDHRLCSFGSCSNPN